MVNIKSSSMMRITAFLLSIVMLLGVSPVSAVGLNPATSDEITINKTDSTFEFKDGAEVKRYYGLEKYTNTLVSLVSTADESAAYSYSIETDEIGATIDEATGEVWLNYKKNKTGKIEVKVTRKADERYNACSKNYTLKIEYLPTPDQAYYIDGTKNESGWYKKDIEIKSPKGYKISYSNEIASADWAEFVTYSEEGENCPVVYLNKDGYMTDKITVDNCKIDKTAPDNLTVEYDDETIWKTILERLFGFYKDTVKVTLSAKDAVSGIDYIEYSTDGVNFATVDEWDGDPNISYDFDINPQYRGKVTFRATDMAGNTKEYEVDKDNRTVVVDKIAPKINVEYNYYESKHQEADDIIYCNDKVKLTFNLTADNFELSEKPVVKVNDVEQIMNWETDKTITSASFELNENGDYFVTFEFTDRLERKATFKKEIHIDKVAPKISEFKFSSGEIKSTNDEGRIFFDKSQTVTFNIKDHNLRAEDVEIIINSVSASGDEFKIEKNSTKDEVAVNISFEKDGNYTLQVKCKDLAGNEATTDESKFTVDKTSPQLKINYENTILNVILEKIFYFIFTKGTVKVTLSAEDAVSGIDYIEYSTDGVNFATVDEWNGEKNIEHRFDIEAKYEDKVTFRATDMVGNTSEYKEDRTVVVDNIAPKIDITYTADPETEIHYNVKDADDFKSATQVFYNGNVTAEIIVNEENFFEGKEYTDENGNPVGIVHEVGILLTKTDNKGDVTKTEYLPKGSAQMFESEIEENIVWKHDGDIHTFKINYAEDADYVLTVKYADFSTNEAEINANDGKMVVGVYESKPVTIDTTPPDISEFKFTPEEIKSTNDEGRIFFDKPQTVTFNIKECNLLSEDVSIKIASTLASDDEEKLKVIEWKHYDSNGNEVTKSVDGYTHEAKINFQADGNYTLWVECTDLAGNKATSKEIRFTVDTTSPVISDFTVTPGVEKNKNNEVRKFYNEPQTVTFDIEDRNLRKEDVEIKIISDSVNADNIKKNFKWNEAKDKLTASVSFEEDANYTLWVECTDLAGNKATSKEIQFTVDKTLPVISDFTLKPGDVIKTVSERVYYNASQTVTFDIEDRNLRAEGVEIKIISDSDSVNAGNIKKNFKWNEAKDKLTASVSFEEDANYTLWVECTDLAGNEAISKEIKFTVDTTKPEVSIKYAQNSDKEELYNNKETKVSIIAKDTVSGIDRISIDVKDVLNEATNIELPKDLVVNADGTVKSGTKGFIDKITSIKDKNSGEITLSFYVPAQFRGKFTATAYDMSGNSATADGDKTVVVDDISPDVKVEFTGSLKDKIDVDVDGQKPTRQTKKTTDANTRFVYDGDITATITVNEANFKSDGMKITVYRDGAVVTDSVISDWTQVDTSEYVKTVKLNKDGDYQIKLEYYDESGNEMVVVATGEYEGKTVNGTYTSNIHTIDTTIPTYSITYDNNTVIQTIGGRDYFDANRTATIKVTDRNFRPNEVDFSVIAKDVTATKDITEFTYSNLKSWDSWTQDGNTWTATVPFTTDANYTVKFAYEDIAEHKMVNAETKAVEAYSKMFTVDKEAPENLTITYLEPTFVERFIEAITFHFYKAPVKVKISATDDVAGVYRFAYSYEKSDNVSTVNAELIDEAITNADITYDGNKATATFTIPKEALADNNQFRGNVEFTAYDRSENDDDTNDPTVVVVDNIAPKIDITYTADPETEIRYVDSDVTDVEDFKSATQVFYNGDVTAKITVNEANFFEGKEYTDENGNKGIVHKVGILLTKTDNNGVVTKTEYLPKGSAQMFESETEENIVWTHDGDIHTFEINYDKDADYVLTVKYADFSTNEAEINANDGKMVVGVYESKTVTVDKIDPVIKVEYSNADVKNTIDGRKYFDKQQVATITVTEHNFRADDIDVDVIAKNIFEEDIDVADFDALMRTKTEWKHYSNGNVHVAKINYTVDANYTFDIKYTDLAMNSSEDYTDDEFTVDKTAPVNLKVEYSKPQLWKEILEDITFGFYNAQMTVTITAEDDISGVYHFLYSYSNNKNVSGVNAELTDEKILYKDIVFDGDKDKTNGKVAKATFTIPKLVLENDNQFNGTVKFTAYNRSEVNDSVDDKEKIVVVVDNIAPTATINYNEPVQKVNNISYYAGNIDANIVINEANFYSEDVVVVVTKDGANYPVKVTWTDNSADLHTGAFTLTQDGDYTVSVTYADRSTNEMIPYTSNQLTIDTKDPVISVSNVKHQSANNNETISFTVSVTDKNIALESFKPVLNVVVKKDNGNNSFTFETMPISLGSAITTTNANGETVYTYSIENLEVDGFYSFACTAVDYANHSVSTINSEADGGGRATVETMNFSVNREGSVFWVETEHNNKYTGEVFIDKLNGAYANDKVTIKLHEINVDKVNENASKKTELTLNDGSESADIELKENDNYSKNVIVGDGGWYETVYTLDNDNFNHDGVYSFNVITYDKAENSNVNTKAEAGTISFTLDRTSPVISANIKSDQSVHDVQFWVEFEISEANLDAETIVVKLTDNRGETVEPEVIDLGNNEYKFLVGSGYKYSIEIAAKDFAGNESELYKVEHFTVSTNILVLWYANTPVFWGSIGGTVLLAGLITLLVFLKKRKKNEGK